MRKNIRGRKPKFDKLVVKVLRDEANLAFSEIAEKLGMPNRQLAYYYYRQALKEVSEQALKQPVDNSVDTKK